MKRAYYIFNSGELSRANNTIKFGPHHDDYTAGPEVRYLPVERISAIYAFGNLYANSSLFNFLGRKQIPIHFFDYYEHYTGTFSPREYLLSGQLLIAQAQAYQKRKKRLQIAKAYVQGAIFNMLKNLKYYQNRGKQTKDISNRIERLNSAVEGVNSIQELMGIEGNCRQAYYESFGEIIECYEWKSRQKRPPTDELNALISFGNSLCYTVCIDAIYNSQLNPTISYLHEPGERRFSLALDVAEIFKPLLVDRLIFRLCNKREIKKQHFDWIGPGCYLNSEGRKVFVRIWEERLQQTIQHRKLGRKVSYRSLVRLDCYKLAKYLLRIDSEFEPFKTWW